MSEAPERIWIEAEPERYKDLARNLLLNQCLLDLENIINGHDPEIHNLNNRVWDRLDKLALDIEARTADLASARVAAVKVKPLDWREGVGSAHFAEKVWESETYFIEKRNHADDAFDLSCSLWDGEVAIRYKTERDAKTAAQADYESRIRSALDAPAALDAMLKAERVKAYNEAADFVDGPDTAFMSKHMLAGAIRALAQEDGE